MKEESAGHFLDGFGIFGPRRIQPRSFKAKILLLQDFDVRFAQTTSTPPNGIKKRDKVNKRVDLRQDYMVNA